MMRVLILLFMLDLLSISSVMNKSIRKKVNGNWRTVYLASSVVEKISEGAPLRTYFRHIECMKKCKKIFLYFYVKSTEENIISIKLSSHLCGIQNQDPGAIQDKTTSVHLFFRKGNNCRLYEITGKKKQEFYQADYEGKTTFIVKKVTEKILLFHYFNKDIRGKVTRVAGVLAKTKLLTKDEMKQYMDFVEEIGIEDENVQRILDTAEYVYSCYILVSVKLGFVVLGIF
ncbi:Probasin [Cricetulus griseus]|uniref:Probasin n=1 Tax=Cricetulus griseus TaxID=10029 RepID=G3I466_CRIGR|nr:Probasin [Cricetulus griseus]